MFERGSMCFFLFRGFKNTIDGMLLEKALESKGHARNSRSNSDDDDNDSEME